MSKQNVHCHILTNFSHVLRIILNKFSFYSGSVVEVYLDDLFKYRYSPWREFPQWKKDLLQRGAEEERLKRLSGNFKKIYDRSYCFKISRLN